MNYKKLKLKSFEMRKKLIEKFFLLKEGHPGSVFSILDILIYLYYSGQVRIKKKKVLDDVIMSKGHATVGQYPILHDLKVLKNNDWKNWGINNKSVLKMFGNNMIPGIKTATGSLGHGIGFGTGIAYAAKKNNIKKKVFVIISEGELYEGSTWEAMMLLSSLKLKNVITILDINNNIILGDPKKCLPLGNIKSKIEGFGLKVFECNGHDFKSIDNHFKKIFKSNKTSCLIVNTIKGKGFQIMENKPNWHYWNPLDQKTYDKMLKDLNKKYE